jgi:hypothetical protein
MKSESLAVKPRLAPIRIYVSWTEYWDLPRYVDHYLKERRLAVNAALRAAVSRRMAKYPGAGPLRKADMDYYLDANACEFIERRWPRAS